MIAELQNALQNLQVAIAPQRQPDTQAVRAWMRSLEAIQSLFQTTVVNADLPNPDISLAVQVEINKQLKMLALDLTMLQTIKNEQTWQKRHQQVGDRLVLLQRYFQG
ncbi:MAG: heterocyst frequency control protein PatD [Pseudanabaenaceae cyanobacterium bins.39]|nr:heterocyst frequency control protein PatD [Pseudanabaenaceae cyanobacterium bins.39]